MTETESYDHQLFNTIQGGSMVTVFFTTGNIIKKSYSSTLWELRRKMRNYR